MESTEERLETGKVSPRRTGRKLPQIDSSDEIKVKNVNGTRPESPASDKDSAEKPVNTSNTDKTEQDGRLSSSGSIAYITETLLTQITKEQRLDMVKSLTIHLPKDELNKKIKYIENLEKLKKLQSLNLSNNMIDKMQKLEPLLELRELNLANNCIKVIECIGHLVKLQTLNLSGNQIMTIPGPSMKKLRCLKVLKLSHNKLDTLLDVTRLRPLQDLVNLDLQGNPFTTLPHYRLFVIFQLRSLDVLDNQAVTKEERLQADQRFSQEEVRRLEVELGKQEKLYQQLQDEKNEAQKMVEHLTKTQNSLKAKEARQGDKIKELEHDIEAKNELLEAKNSDLIKASKNQYWLEQELAFYKLDAKFEMFGELPLMDDEAQPDEDHGLEDSTYIGKATFKRNMFAHEQNLSDPVQMTHMKSLKIKHEEDPKIRDALDEELQEKRTAIRQLQEHLEKLAQDVEDKNNQIQNAAEKLASLELAMANQMATVGKGNDLARKQLAEKIEFIKRLQAAAEELEERMNMVAEDVARKQKELDELRKMAEKADPDNDTQLDLRQALDLKQAELHEACAELSKMKEDLERLKRRIAEEQAQVEMLREQLGKEKGGMPEEVVRQLKEELEGVIQELNERQEEQENRAREQRAKINDLEKERDLLKGKLAKGKEMKENISALQEQLNDVIQALEDEREKCHELEEREKELCDQLSAYDKNNKLELIEAQSKLRHLGKENERLQDLVNQLKNQIKNEREGARARVQRDQERIAKALEAARMAGDKDKEMKGLALQVDALKATNEALNDRLEEAENELRKKEEDSVGRDQLLERLNDLLSDLKRGEKKVKQPVDETDGVGQCLADLHRKYLDLANKLENERQKGKQKLKQAKITIDNLESELAQAKSQLTAAEHGLAQLTQEGTAHEADMKNMENDVHRLQENLKAALRKAEDEVNRRMREKDSYEEKIEALEDEVERLQDELKNKQGQQDKELNEMGTLAKRQKDRLDNEIHQLQDELQELKDQHWKELKRKDEEITELEAQLSEDEKLIMEEKNKKEDDLRRELGRLRRLVSDRANATEDAINKEMETKRTQRDLEGARRRIDADMKTTQKNIHRLEKLLDAKEQQIQALRKRGVELDHTVAVLSREIEALKDALANQNRDLPELATVRRSRNSKEHDRVAPMESRHRVYTHSVPVNHDVYQTIRHHHYDNSVPFATLTRDYTAPQTRAEVSTAPGLDQVHHHHHYGNGEFTMNLKKSKPRKRDYCNISEHEELVDDVMSLEEKLATANTKLSSQMTENKLSALRSDLQDLERTVAETFRHKKSMDPWESRLCETLARFQDHLLTIMDHRANLSSGNT